MKLAMLEGTYEACVQGTMDGRRRTESRIGSVILSKHSTCISLIFVLYEIVRGGEAKREREREREGNRYNT